MPGLLDTGLDYQRRAIGGMVKESGQELSMWEQNKELKAQEEIGRMKMIGELVGAGSGIVMGLLPLF